MNKFIITVISALLMAGTGSVFGQASDDGSEKNKSERKRQHNQRGMRAAEPVQKLMRTLRHLDLSDEQKASTRAILEVMKAEIHPIMVEMKTAQKQLKELISSSDFDEDAIRALAEKEGDLTAERIMITSLGLSRILGELTDEQRAELGAMAAERDERRNEQRGKKHKQKTG